jgi:hypothetical protein
MKEAYSWTASYERAVAEIDVAQLHARVIEAEDAMLTRSLEIPRDAMSPETQAELVAIRDAADGLLKIKRDKLQWRLT